jgi:hypothetical protein
MTRLTVLLVYGTNGPKFASVFHTITCLGNGVCAILNICCTRQAHHRPGVRRELNPASLMWSSEEQLGVQFGTYISFRLADHGLASAMPHKEKCRDQLPDVPK